jgi:hypothetical protein
MIELDTEKRNQELVVKFKETNATLEELGTQYALSRERVRQILSLELGENKYKKLIDTRRSSRGDETGKLLEDTIQSIADEIVDATDKGQELPTILSICEEYDVTVALASSVRDHVITSLGREHVHMLALKRIKTKNLQYTDKEIVNLAKRAYKDISADGKSFSSKNYSDWRDAQKEPCPTPLTLLKRLSNDNRWSDVKALASNSKIAHARGPGGPQRAWDHNALMKVLRDFLAWSHKNKRMATQTAYLEYQEQTSVDTPSISIIRVRLGSWMNALETAKNK